MSDTSTISPGQHTPSPSIVSGTEPERVTAFLDDEATRVVAAGSCKAFLVSGKVRLPCTCLEGRFELLLDGEDGFLCEHCRHHLVDHQDFGGKRVEGTVSELQAAPALEAVEGKASVAVWRNAVTEQTQKPAEISANQTNSTKSLRVAPSPRVQAQSTPTKQYESPESGGWLLRPRSADQPEDSMAQRTPQQLKLIANAKAHPNQIHVDASRFSLTDVPRTTTLKKLLGKILQHRIVQAIGPRYSGKSTLASQLASVACTNGLRVCHTVWPEDTASLHTLSPENALLSVLKKNGYEYGNVDTGMKNTLIIIDEAERLSSFTQLWETFFFKRIGAMNGPFVVLFGTGLDFRHEPPVMQPLLPEHHRIPLKPTDDPLGAGVYYEKSEFVEAVRNVCLNKPHVIRRFEPMSCLIDTLWYYSDGHPGFTNAITDLLSSSEECVEAIWKAHESEGSIYEISCLPQIALVDLSPVAELIRSLDNATYMPQYPFYTLRYQQEQRVLAALDVVLACPGQAARLPRCLDPDVQKLVNNRVLFAFPDGQGGYVASFPIRLYQMTYEKFRTTDLTSSAFFDKVELVIPGEPREISSFLSIILVRMGTIRKTQPPKSNASAADYEDLFYQAVNSVLGGSFMRTNDPVPLGANLSSAPPRFTIAGSKWGFEIYSNGEGFSDRVSMYKPGGCIDKWRMDSGSDGITVLDFRPDGDRDLVKGPDWHFHYMSVDPKDFSPLRRIKC